MVTLAQQGATITLSNVEFKLNEDNSSIDLQDPERIASNLLSDQL